MNFFFSFSLSHVYVKLLAAYTWLLEKYIAKGVPWWLSGLRTHVFTAVAQLAAAVWVQSLAGELRHAVGMQKKFFLNDLHELKLYSSCCGSAVTNLTSIHDDVGSILALLSGLRVW